MVETAGSHFSVALEPEKVPSRLRQTWSGVGGEVSQEQSQSQSQSEVRVEYSQSRVRV